jgi:predicted  nucleic acid-binding Zn-ribbon protein
MNLSIKELNELIYSLGIASHNGRFVNKDVNESLLEKLYSELNSKIADEAIDEEVESSTYYVTNEEADEDAKQRDYSAFNDYASTLQQDSDRYESSVMKDYTNYVAKLNERGFVTQALLDYVDKKGAVSYSELQTYYRQITGGSNSFSHILDNLRTPYKNRKTQRYIAKEGKRYTDALYVIKVANPSNWVVA